MDNGSISDIEKQALTPKELIKEKTITTNSCC